MTFDIAGLDVGKSQDYSAIVIGNVDPPNNILRIKAAKRWARKTDYKNVERDVEQIYKKTNLHFIGIEINGPGAVLHDHLKARGVRVKPVTTMGKITDIQKQRDFTKMSKPQYAKWILMAKQQNVIRFPAKSTKYLDELIEQIPLFKEHITEAGQAQYYAEGRSHDDLVMAMMVMCRFASKWIKLNGDGGIRAGPAYPSLSQSQNQDPIELHDESMRAMGLVEI